MDTANTPRPGADRPRTHTDTAHVGSEPVPGERPRADARDAEPADTRTPDVVRTSPAPAPDTTAHVDSYCDGGHRGDCPHRAVWRIRAAGGSGAWTHACGIHLPWAACESAAGGHSLLDLRHVTAEQS